jgi:hypothetical protein
VGPFWRGEGGIKNGKSQGQQIAMKISGKKFRGIELSL